MANQPQFQLFPAQGQSKPNGNSFKRSHGSHGRRSSKSPAVSPVAEESRNKSPSSQTETVIFQIIRDTNIITPPSPAHTNKAKSPTSMSKSNARKDSAVSPQSWAKPTSRPNSPPQGSVQSSWPLTGDQNEVTLLPPASPTEIPVAPPLPMRSIFPRYDPDVPLNKQRYYPQQRRVQDIPMDVISRSDYSPSLTSPRRTTKSRQSSKSSENEPAYSKFASTEELVRLWEVINAADVEKNLETLHLSLRRIDMLTFAFGNDCAGFYTLRTNAMSDIEIERSHPNIPNTKSPVININLGGTSHVDLEGNVALIFPVLAEIAAKEQAFVFSRDNKLPSTKEIQVENETITQAKAHHSCNIKWNAVQKRYDLYHQALFATRDINSRGSGDTPGNPSRTRRVGVLHLTISTSTSKSRKLHHSPTLLITAPGLPAEETTSASPNNDTPLVALDLETKTLSVSAGLINTLIPSAYAIDTLVASILAVAVFDQSTKPVLAGLEIEAPRPEDFPIPSHVNSPSISPTSRTFNGKFITTQAEREDEERQEAAQEETLMSHFESSEPKSRSFFWRRNKTASTQKQKPKKKQIVVDEIDLESYGRYGSGSTREGEKLPGVTRTALRAIFWLYGAIVAALGFVVKSIAWILVTMTRCATSERT